MDKFSVNSIVALVATIFTWLFGTWDIAISVLVTFMALDYCTGLIKGYVLKKLSSNIGLKGLARKAVIFIVLIVAVSLDRLSGSGQWVFRTLVCYFYIANEGLSIVENCAQLGLPIPKKIKEALIQLKEGGKKSV
ncbi:toxin secretion/phage lysis holin [Ruminiclostridium papyrosolvens DSM 2782]|uniref:Toxin secretion/phage lysis holin n=1 Tax=Ruminiclostridium papyrosolvens DSM 2782 TaxID=588581 RepID=F1TEI4_9FIRM|nr:phage holin family protein [Ruminiclostridium papyrosolvens]EGD47150.1 toxin secretion/phage lysis holin [Ruminiclostridium papyrosolvens DSM 2782]WES36092.1 phage holin family protein [Ruminiclostridium papyrosolvens DSM 2782]WES36190.1 phage holin family protein [Ruminiclostridium papyrosolvens DSM 2782]